MLCEYVTQFLVCRFGGLIFGRSLERRVIGYRWSSHPSHPYFESDRRLWLRIDRFTRSIENKSRKGHVSIPMVETIHCLHSVSEQHSLYGAKITARRMPDACETTWSIIRKIALRSVEKSRENSIVIKFQVYQFNKIRRTQPCVRSVFHLFRNKFAGLEWFELSGVSFTYIWDC